MALRNKSLTYGDIKNGQSVQRNAVSVSTIFVPLCVLLSLIFLHCLNVINSLIYILESKSSRRAIPWYCLNVPILPSLLFLLFILASISKPSFLLSSVALHWFILWVVCPAEPNSILLSLFWSVQSHVSRKDCKRMFANMFLGCPSVVWSPYRCNDLKYWCFTRNSCNL